MPTLMQGKVLQSIDAVAIAIAQGYMLARARLACPPEKLHRSRYFRNNNGLRDFNGSTITKRGSASRQWTPGFRTGGKAPPCFATSVYIRIAKPQRKPW